MLITPKIFIDKNCFVCYFFNIYHEVEIPLSFNMKQLPSSSILLTIKTEKYVTRFCLKHQMKGMEYFPLYGTLKKLI